MAWSNGGQGSHIPQWVKRKVDDRQDDMCMRLNPAACWGTIDEYDHIVNVKATGQQRRDLERDPDLIQGLCQPCHRVKTQLEAKAGRQKRSGKRKPRPHPADALKDSTE